MNRMHASHRPEWLTQPHKSDKESQNESVHRDSFGHTSLHRCMRLCPCPTWGPHPWQGCRVAVWFSFTPWSIHRWLTLELRIWNHRASFINPTHLHLSQSFVSFVFRRSSSGSKTHIKHSLQPCVRSFVACLFQRLHRVQMFQGSGLYYFFLSHSSDSVWGCLFIIYFSHPFSAVFIYMYKCSSP